MEKTTKHICLDVDIVEKVKQMKKEWKFNFSDWINKTFRDNFMGVEVRKLKIEQMKKDIKILNKEIKDIQLREKAYEDMLTSTEKRFLRQVPILLKKGCEFLAVHRRFNILFKREVDLEEFKLLVKVVDKKRNGRRK